MARKFITSKEHAFIHSINKELMQNFVQQEILYYGISLDESTVDDLYDEAIEKVWLAPVTVNARVHWDNPGDTSANGTVSSEYALEAYCHTKELQDRNLQPRSGDFVEFGQVVFEITSVTTPQLVFGQVNNKIMTKLVCIPSREGQFKIDSSRKDGIDNSHPVQEPRPRSLGQT